MKDSQNRGLEFLGGHRPKAAEYIYFMYKYLISLLTCEDAHRQETGIAKLGRSRRVFASLTPSFMMLPQYLKDQERTVEEGLAKNERNE